MAVAVNPNIASNLSKNRRRRGRKMPPGLQKIKDRLGPDGIKQARAVGLRRRGGAPASDTRRRSTRGLPVPPRPVSGTPRIDGREGIGARVDVPAALAKARAAAKTRAGSSSSTPPTTTSVKPPKPAVPAGQPPAYGARRKTTLPPGLAKRASSGSAMPKPPKRPKRPKGY